VTAHRILIYGNAGSGKTTMARETARALGVPHLDLDAITWEVPMVRKELSATLALLADYVAKNPAWVIEGVYGDVIAAAAPHCTELRFLNPGVDACVAHCKLRPWEPSKFASKEEQDRLLAPLLDWVATYETRDDEYGLARHRAVFEAFTGNKREYN
jgi:hypothetical protein